MLDQISYHGNTAGHVPMLFLMRLTFVDDERTAELISTADFGQTTAEFPIWATRWPTATPPLLSRMQSEKKGVLTVALKALFLPWEGKRGEQLFLDYRAGKVFWCSTCSCLIKPRLKVLLPRTPYASEQPSLCHAVIYDHCATLIPRSALLHKTCFPPPFLFFLFLQLEERIVITKCVTDGFFPAEQVELALDPSESFSPTLGCLRAFKSVHLISFVPLHLWHNIIAAKPTETCKPVLLHFWTACKQIRTHYSNYLTSSIQIFNVLSSTASMLFHACCGTDYDPPACFLPLDTAGQEWELVPRAWCFYCWWCLGISSHHHLFSFHLLHTFQSLQGRKKQTEENHKASAALLFKSGDFACDCALADSWHASLHWDLCSQDPVIPVSATTETTRLRLPGCEPLPAADAARVGRLEALIRARHRTLAALAGLIP